MTVKDVLLIIFPVLSGILGSYLTYFFTIKSKKNETIFKYKEEKYAKLLILLKGFVGTTASSELKKEFFDEQYKSWIYCSDEVVKAINKMVKLASNPSPDPERGREAIGDIVLAIRKDLLNSKTNLKYTDFIYTDVHG
jgi:hypothetical protein